MLRAMPLSIGNCRTGRIASCGVAEGALSNGFDVLALISRRSRAALELPTRLARCHSPFEFWSAQAQFMQEGFADCQSVALLMMTGPLHALSNGRQ